MLTTDDEHYSDIPSYSDACCHRITRGVEVYRPKEFGHDLRENLSILRGARLPANAFPYRLRVNHTTPG